MREQKRNEILQLLSRAWILYAEKFFKNPVDIFNGLLYDIDNKENEGEKFEN